MHEPQASALHNRERHCIIREHHIETRIVVIIAGHVVSGQSDCFHVTTEFEKSQKQDVGTAIELESWR